ncbi:hypothetical protein BDR26DRAFT_942381 [Obelidium mucronatum]|nr:hypothetical protein BDR26DRAFT_942381 [Obelidium mucronatum]
MLATKPNYDKPCITAPQSLLCICLKVLVHSQSLDWDASRSQVALLTTSKVVWTQLHHQLSPETAEIRLFKLVVAMLPTKPNYDKPCITAPQSLLCICLKVLVHSQSLDWDASRSQVALLTTSKVVWTQLHHQLSPETAEIRLFKLVVAMLPTKPNYDKPCITATPISAVHLFESIGAFSELRLGCMQVAGGFTHHESQVALLTTSKVVWTQLHHQLSPETAEIRLFKLVVAMLPTKPNYDKPCITAPQSLLCICLKVLVHSQSLDWDASRSQVALLTTSKVVWTQLHHQLSPETAEIRLFKLVVAMLPTKPNYDKPCITAPQSLLCICLKALVHSQSLDWDAAELVVAMLPTKPNYDKPCITAPPSLLCICLKVLVHSQSLDWDASRSQVALLTTSKVVWTQLHHQLSPETAEIRLFKLVVVMLPTKPNYDKPCITATQSLLCICLKALVHSQSLDWDASRSQVALLTTSKVVWTQLHHQLSPETAEIRLFSMHSAWDKVSGL